MAIGLAAYALLASIEDATVLFVRSIPIFIAIPIMPEYDNLNTWRILAIIIFIKLLWPKILNFQFLNFNEFSILKFVKQLQIYSKLLILLFVFAVLSIIPAVDKIAAITRVIYFVNLSLIGIVIYYLTKDNEQFSVKLIKNIAIPTIIVTIVGYIQLTSTYFIDIYQFMRIWGEGIQMRQFGVLWSNIAVRLGNTWFAYYGEQLSLRVFSLFPDSHSFPQFVLLGMPSIFAISLVPILNLKSKILSLGQMIKTRTNISVLWIPTMLLIVILSGTRGIWAASAGVILIIFLVLLWLKKTNRKDLVMGIFTSGDVKMPITIFKYISLYMIIFFLLFAVAYPIFVSPQFLIGKKDANLFSERIKSIVDFGETSNNQRIEIWKASLESIKKRLLLGVGIGNFPVILDQRIFLARAGSSAHNIYLHIAAEMGIPALIAAIWFLWLVFRKSYDNFLSARANIQYNSFLAIYYGATLIFVPWVLIYSLTDVALFDERAFLLFVATISIILGNKIPAKPVF